MPQTTEVIVSQHRQFVAPENEFFEVVAVAEVARTEEGKVVGPQMESFEAAHAVQQVDGHLLKTTSSQIQLLQHTFQASQRITTHPSTDLIQIQHDLVHSNAAESRLWHAGDVLFGEVEASVGDVGQGCLEGRNLVHIGASDVIQSRAPTIACECLPAVEVASAQVEWSSVGGGYSGVVGLWGVEDCGGVQR